MDWNTLPLPLKLQSRPKDGRGLPIPAAVVIDENGTPDFRVTDVLKWQRLAKARCCGLCGEPLERMMAFVGGPVSHQSRFFTDLPMHRPCAEYALQVCPYLAAPNYRYAEQVANLAGYVVQVNDQVANTRPDRFFLALSRHFTLGRLPTGELVIRARPWEGTWWWRNGKPLVESPSASHKKQQEPLIG